MPDDVIQRLFDKFDEMKEDFSEKLTELKTEFAGMKATMEERDKHDSDDNHETRIHALELWQATQQGVSGFLQKWLPVVVTILIAIYTAKAGHVL